MKFTILYKQLSILSTITALLLLQGCAANKVNLSSADRASLKQLKQVKVVHVRAGWPMLKTPLGVIASDLTLGLSEDWSEGQKLMHKFKIKDPINTVKRAFVQRLANARVARFAHVTKPITFDEMEDENLKKKYKKGVVLKVMPAMWQIWYYPFNWARYQMWFRASAQLVRLEDSKVLWSATCIANQDDSKTAPTLDELTADNSKVLQGWVAKATSQCAKQLANDFMTISTKQQ